MIGEKIIYIGYLPLTKNIEKIFYIDFLIERGVNIEYWDITNIFFKNLKINENINRNYLRRFDNFKNLKIKLKEEDIKKVIIIPIITLDGTTLKLFRILSKYNFKIFYFDRGRLPNLNVKVIKKIFTHLNYLINLKKLFIFILNSIVFLYKKLNLIKKYNVVFTAGNVAFSSYTKISKLVKINYFDYDDYLIVRKINKRLVKKRYAVFLDGYLPYHPDFIIVKLRTIDPVRYYELINNFFKIVEHKYNIDVVVAAHPKAKYKINMFDGRNIFYYKTNELVKDCEFVIAHMSTSISYAILYKKPILFTYTDEMEKLYHNTLIKFINSYVNATGGNIYNLDKIRHNDHITLNKIDLNKYNEYKYNYLTSKETENIFSREIVLNCFKDNLI